jgi:hypothetical protein
MHRGVHRRDPYLFCRHLDGGWLNGSGRRGVRGRGKRIGIVVLQWRNLGYTDGRHGLYRDEHRSGLHLYGWLLGHRWRNRSGRRSVYHGGKYIGIAVLQWRNLDYTRAEHSMYRDVHRRGIHLFG